MKGWKIGVYFFGHQWILSMQTILSLVLSYSTSSKLVVSYRFSSSEHS